VVLSQLNFGRCFRQAKSKKKPTTTCRGLWILKSFQATALCCNLSFRMVFSNTLVCSIASSIAAAAHELKSAPCPALIPSWVTYCINAPREQRPCWARRPSYSDKRRDNSEPLAGRAFFPDCATNTFDPDRRFSVA